MQSSRAPTRSRRVAQTRRPAARAAPALLDALHVVAVALFGQLGQPEFAVVFHRHLGSGAAHARPRLEFLQHFVGKQAALLESLAASISASSWWVRLNGRRGAGGSTVRPKLRFLRRCLDRSAGTPLPGCQPLVVATCLDDAAPPASGTCVANGPWNALESVNFCGRADTAGGKGPGRQRLGVAGISCHMQTCPRRRPRLRRERARTRRAPSPASPGAGCRRSRTARRRPSVRSRCRLR